MNAKGWKKTGGMAAVAAGMVLVATVWALPVQAQSCCAASQTAGPVRLSLGQVGAVGVAADTKFLTGRFSGSEYRRLENPVQQWRQTLFGAYRLGDAWQIGATLPFAENRHRVGDEVEWGWGIGDVGGQARYELVATGASMRWPGIGVTAGVNVPTGRAPEQSVQRGQSQWMSDVTGTGRWEVGVGAQLEWVWGRSFLATEATIFQALPFEDGEGAQVLLMPRVVGRVSVGRPVNAAIFWDESLYLAGGLQVQHGGSRRVDGELIAGSVERVATMSVQAGAYLTETSYLMVQGMWDMTFDFVGENRQVGPSVGVVYRRVFYDEW